MLKKTCLFVVLLSIIVLTACSSPAATTSQPSAPATTTAGATTATIAPATSTPTAPATTAKPAGPAAVSTTGVINITFTGAVLKAAIDNPGEESIDQRGFDWGTAAGSYEFEWVESGEFLSGDFNRLLQGLKEGQMYYFRGKMHTAAGWKYGAEMNFRTLEEPKVNSIGVISGLLGQTLDITITGSGYAGVTEVSFGSGINVNDFQVTDYNHIIASITIAADAATGPRDISVTTPLGTGTLAGSFTVKQVMTVVRTVVWKNADFNTLLHHLTTDAAAQYEIRFHDNNQMTVVTTQGVNIWTEVRDGKLAFSGVTQSLWDNIFSTAGAYISYDSAARVMIIDTLPEIVLETLFNPAETVTPVIISAIGVESQVTVRYYSQGEVG